MNHAEFQDEIISVIKSSSLKAEIKRSRHVFSDDELLVIAYKFADTYDQRLRLLELVKQNTSPDIAKWANECIEWQKKSLKSFIKQEPNTVYELHIKENPNSYDERYLCSSYEVALKLIPRFYAEYNTYETKNARYHICKRKIMSIDVPQKFEEDWLGDCFLIEKSIIQSVRVDTFPHEKIRCNCNCMDCENECVDHNEICFPHFLENKDIAKYKDIDEVIHYGVTFRLNSEMGADVYIIPLDSNAIHYKDFENAHDAHKHIDAPFVEKSCIEELPEYLKPYYKAYAEYLQTHEY